MPGTSNLLSLVTVAGDRKPYLQIERVEGLAAVAQVAAVELHPWNCKPKAPERCRAGSYSTSIRGPDVPFETVVAAAREMHDRLDALGLVSFCKTTGGKGLHIVTPLATTSRKPLAWPAAKDFAREVCSRLARDNPELYLVNMSKKLRNGRIFLDYLRKRSPLDGCGALVATWTPGRDRIDAPYMDAGEVRSRSEEVHDPHGAGSPSAEQSLGRL